MLRSYIEGGKSCVQYVDIFGCIANLRFQFTAHAPQTTYAFVAHGVVWFYELEPDTNLATHLRPAVNGQDIATIVGVNTFIADESVIVLHWQQPEFVLVIELRLNQQPLIYERRIDVINKVRCWLWYDREIRPVFHKKCADNHSTDIVISIPYYVDYLNVRRETLIFDINCDGVCIIRLLGGILAGWCIVRNAIMWVHNYTTAGNEAPAYNAKYVSSNVIQYCRASTWDISSWHYYNVTDGTAYDVC